MCLDTCFNSSLNHLSVYIDTSVYLGYFDTAFKTSTRVLWRLHSEGHIHFNSSDLTLEHAQSGPACVRALVEGTLSATNMFKKTEASEVLARGYLERGILGFKGFQSARHAALCAVSSLDTFVSVDASQKLNAENNKALNCFNQLQGYSHVRILSPSEFITQFA